jgi:hypothetical protein
MKLVSVALLTGLAVLPAFPQANEQAWPCGLGSEVLKRGKAIVWLSSDELDRRATQRVAPKLPPTLRVAGSITVDVIIGIDGQVKCVRTQKGHPILKKAAIEAARGWTFRPYEVDGRRQVVCGHLLFKVSQ